MISPNHTRIARQYFTPAFCLFFFLLQVGVASATPLSSSRVRQDLWDQFVAANGPWIPDWNENGTLRRAVGSGIRVAIGSIENQADALMASRGFLSSHGSLLGFDLDQGELIHCTRGRDLWFVLLRQRLEGLEVVGSQVDLRIHESGVLSLFGGEGVALRPPPSLVPGIAAVEAGSVVLDALMSQGFTPVLTQDPILKIHPMENQEGPLLVFHVTAENSNPIDSWDAFVDAQTGGLLHLLSRRADASVSGHVTAFGSGTGPPTLFPPQLLSMNNLVVRIPNGTETLTDPDGSFVLELPGPGPLEIVARLQGPWVDVSSTLGGNLVLRTTVSDGDRVSLTLNRDSINERTLAQVNAHFQTTFVHDWLKGVSPEMGRIDLPVLCRVNLAGRCNAFYVSNTINFLQAGGNCLNSSYETFIYHEYGHFADDRYGGIRNPSLSEGLADIVATFASGQPLMGKGYRGTSEALRSVERTEKWPALRCESLHCVGLTAAGFAWKVRQELIKRQEDAGRVIAEEIVINTILANNNRIPDFVIEVFLLDDDDGNLLNGTPHGELLHEAALSQGFLHVPRLPRVESIEPATSDTFRGSRITFTGGGFAGNETEVLIDGQSTRVLEKAGDHSCVIESPLATDVGPVDLKIVNAFGELLIPGGFDYQSPPRVFGPSRILVGESATLRVGGPKNSDFVLIASVEDAGSVLAPQGVPLDIGPRQRVLADTVFGPDLPLSETGLAEVSFRVPRHALMHGGAELGSRPIFFQAVIFPDSGPPLVSPTLTLPLEP